MTGAAKMTVLSLLAEVGTACAAFQDRWIRNLDCQREQVDEIWSFVGMKSRNVPVEKRGIFGYGDVWTFTALDADSKLLVTWKLGTRSQRTTIEFLNDLASRLNDRIQLTSDRWHTYPVAVDAAFGYDAIDYAALVKIYGEAPKEDDGSTVRVTSFVPS
jgi:IS1 family transposase